MKIAYDGVGDTLSIIIQEEQIVNGEEHGPVIVNYNEKGKPVEIEILNASKFLGEFLSIIIRAKAGEKQLEIARALETTCNQPQTRQKTNLL
jgi:uncharacterized protein YuzE